MLDCVGASPDVLGPHLYTDVILENIVKKSDAPPLAFFS